MKSNAIVTIFLALMGAAVADAAAQEMSTDSRRLFTVGGEEVKVSEFEYVYNKNNISGDADYSQESLDEYLELYVNFRLKVKEAEAQGLDTVKRINDELGTYRKQLARSYLTDKQILDKLIQEAYERMKKEVHVSHLMVRLAEDAMPGDTLEAYNRAVQLLKGIKGGQAFETVARMNSDDPSVKDNGGDLGYQTVFSTVYPFENAMYKTKPGTVSGPIRTRFGYHLVKVSDVRDASGSIQIAQIFIKKGKKATPEDLAAAEAKAKTISKDIKSGKATFEDHVIANSDDSKTKNRRGVLTNPTTGSNWFQSGQLFPEVEAVAFALLEENDVSDPVETAIGWHIIKLIDRKGVDAFKEVRGQLKVKVERDSRSKIAKDVMLKRIKRQYSFSEDARARTDMFQKIDEGIITGTWRADDKSAFTKVLFTLGDTRYNQVDFIDYLERNLSRAKNPQKDRILDNYYDRFVEVSCFEYEEMQLEMRDPYFRALMKEYRDGILLFELTDEMVWSKAIKDTAGLKIFHEGRRTEYMWKERASAVVYVCRDADVAGKVRAMIGKKEPAEIVAKLTKKSPGAVGYTTGKYERGQNEVVDKKAWMPGIGDNLENPDQTISVVHITEMVQPEPKALNEAKGYVVSDYQEHLEKQWITELRAKYPVDINQEVFRSLVK